MSTPYNQSIGRAGAGYDTGGTGDALVPEPLSNSIYQELPKASAALSLMRRIQLSAKTQRMPVLDVLPMAYWVNGDTGLKQTSTQAWKNVVMVVEELACIIPIPQAYLDDADVPIWDEVQPRMTEAAGQLIDLAVLWGINKPSTWGISVFGGAVNSGNVVHDGAGVDLGQDVASLGELMALTGYTVNGFAGAPGLNWRMIGLRSAQGIPIFAANTIADQKPGMGGSLYGFPIAMPENNSWQLGSATMLAGDWSKSIIGVRQDISYKLFTEGVVSDNTGKVILNLMQQDAVAMRMVMRLAYATVNPVTIMQPSKTLGVGSGVPNGTGGTAPTLRWPFGVITAPGYTIPSANVGVRDPRLVTEPLEAPEDTDVDEDVPASKAGK